MNYLAQITNPSLGNTGAGSFQGNSEGYIVRLISTLITSILILGVISFTFYFLLGGITWITSGGDAKKAEAARSRITQAVIGLVVLLSAWAVFQLVETLFGIHLINIDLSILYL